MKKAFLILPLMAIFFGCSPKNSADATTGETFRRETSQPIAVSLPPVGMMPKATAIKINPEYADKVAVTLGADGKLTYFPAPTDISADSAPLRLCGGWWLNRQGVGENSVFTKYTFSEYAALKTVPSTQQLLDAIIPGSGVEEIMTLPFNISSAAEHIDEIKQIVCPQ